MSHKDTSFRADQTDDTNYEAWLRQHALADKVEASNETKVMSSRESSNPETSEITTVPYTSSNSSVLEADTVLDTDLPEDYQSTKPTYSFGLAKLLVVLVPLLFLAGYYSYSSVSGATFFGKTLSNNVNLQNGLVGHWTFDGGDISTTTAFDMSDQGNDAALLGFAASTPKPAIGKMGQGVQLSGISGSDGHFEVTSAASIENLPALSFGAWVRTNTPNVSQHILSKGFGSSNPDNGWIFRIDSFGGLEFRTAFNTQDLIRTSTSSIIKQNRWHYVNVTWDGSSSASNARIYVDGIEVEYKTTINGSGSRVADDSGTSHDVRIGNSPGLSLVFNGILDDVRIYNRVLSAKEVEALYSLGEGSKINVTQTPDNLQTGLVGHWTFDGPDMNALTQEANDVSGNNNHAQLNDLITAKVKPSIGKIGQGIKYPGISGTSYYSVDNGVSASSTTGITISAWIKPDVSSTGHIVSRGSGSADSQNGWIFRSDSTNALEFRVGFNTTDLRRVTATDFVSTGEWQLVTMTWDGSSTASSISLYRNGFEATSYTTSQDGTSVKDSDWTQVQIGRSSGGSAAFNGTLDDIRIYNRALSADEVEQLYTLGSGSTIKICKEASVQDADSNTYNTLAIGSQCWLDRNMNVGTRIGVLTNQTNNVTIEKYCYNDTDSNCTTNNPNKPDGGLYQWDEAMQYSTTEGARGICPVGFHIPTDAEWHTLEKFLLDGGATCSATRVASGCAPAGTKLKPGGRSLFESNLAGYANSVFFSDRGSSSYFWSSSVNSSNAWYRFVGSGALVSRSNIGKTLGFSIRCLQD